MKRFITLMLMLIILLTGCSLPYKKAKEASAPADINDRTATTESGVANDPTDKMIPQKYIDFMKKKDEDPNDSIVFYAKEDIDMDGRDEIVIASGMQGEDAESSIISYATILRENNGGIEEQFGNLAGSAYNTYEIKLIKLQDMPQKYIYAGLTNGDGLLGFNIFELKNNNLETICESASATGSGEDYLTDNNKDGMYDGYEQNRSSYDVLYYPLTRSYVLEHNEFVLRNTSVEMPEYPKDIKDIIVQYISLRFLEEEKSKEINKRLSELCLNEAVRKFNIPDDWYQGVSDTIMEFDNGIKFIEKDMKDTAIVTASYTTEDKKKYKIAFTLKKKDERWQIDNIE